MARKPNAARPADKPKPEPVVDSWDSIVRKHRLHATKLKQAVLGFVPDDEVAKAREALEEFTKVQRLIGAGCPHNQGTRNVGMDSVCAMCGDWV